MQQTLGTISGRLSRGIQRRLGPNIVSRALNELQNRSFSSQSYWEQRYQSGGDSGAGSFGTNAKFKAQFLNEFAAQSQISSVLELGCGDGNQLDLYQFPHYRGYDVSPRAIELCKAKFEHDTSKSFHLHTQTAHPLMDKAELTLSIDVIFHLVEQHIFEAHLRDLFAASTRYVIIFSTAFDKRHESPHHCDRDFRQHISDNFNQFRLSQIVENPFKGNDSQADFFVYQKT
tara:strand:+ start:56824 stop:57513 length:690 start_codon:yes stop_codon:yes gene_type:complete